MTSDETQTPSETNSLREELGATLHPEFELTLPPGWSRVRVTESTESQLQEQLKQRFMPAHRPDLYGQASQMLQSAMAQMSQAGVTDLFMAAEQTPETLVIPASMTASYLIGEDGEPVDSIVSALIAKRNGQRVPGDGRWVKFEEERTNEMQGERLTTTLVTYLTPVPGSQRRRALRLAATIVRPADAPSDDEPMVRMRQLFDVLVTTLRWKVAEPPTTGE